MRFISLLYILTALPGAWALDPKPILEWTVFGGFSDEQSSQNYTCQIFAGKVIERRVFPKRDPVPPEEKIEHPPVYTPKLKNSAMVTGQIAELIAHPKPYSGASVCDLPDEKMSVLGRKSMLLIQRKNCGANLFDTSKPAGLLVGFAKANCTRKFSEAPAAAKGTRSVMFISDPPGAEIWINGLSTGLKTPNRIDIPGEAEYELQIKKPGYADSVPERLRNTALNAKITTILKKP